MATLARDVTALVDEAALLDVARGMLRFPSLSGQEKPLAEYLANWLGDRSFDVELQEAQPDRPNVIAIARGAGDGPSIMLNGHVDISFTDRGWTRDPFAPALEDGWLYGAGVTNMKGAVASMIAAADAVRRADLGPRGDVIVTAVMGECDKLGTGTKHLLDCGITADAGICGEATDFVIQVAHGGTYQFELRTLGREAHTSRIEDGVDAIQKMIKLLGAVGISRLAYEPHPDLPDLPRLVVGRIEGGQRSSRTAAWCLARGDVRLVPGMSAQGIKRDFERVIAELAADDPDFKASVHSLTYQRPFLQPREGFVVRAVAAAHRAMTGRDAEVGTSLPVQAFATDASHMLRAGVPTVVYGPGVWRTDPDERMLVEDLVLAARVYAQAAIEVTTADRTALA